MVRRCSEAKGLEVHSIDSDEGFEEGAKIFIFIAKRSLHQALAIGLSADEPRCSLHRRPVSNKFINITMTIEFFGNIDTMTIEGVIGSFKAYEEKVKLRRTRVDEQLLLARGHDSS
ncbi:hypothetical protein GUJ93_ZPchr0005g14872 [Zizania palustris]|uniref:Uncharacterized protein n=1 Tax=Zizania palustris TaxID=103762 RepID=A0A8J5SGT9_ZIZPA|nr:hypothetical protein GUJ93_ZPchr0005g14872 [Zizania palustris]